MTEEMDKEPGVPKGTLMAGKRGLIMGVANDKSLAWGITKYLHAQGAELAFTFQGEALEKRVRTLAASVGSEIILPCDVTDAASMDNVFSTLQQKWGTMDFLVHAIAYSDKNELKGQYVDTTLDNFLMTMNISCYSFVALARRAKALMPNGGGIITLTYYGAEKVIPHYNVMGVAKAALETSVRYLAADLGAQKIRVNAISAGPVRTLAASGIKGFGKILEVVATQSPIRRNVTIEDVGNVAAFLLSDLAAGVSAEITYVDGGFSQVVYGIAE